MCAGVLPINMLLSDVTLARAMEVDTSMRVSKTPSTYPYAGTARIRKEEYSQLNDLLGSSSTARYVMAICPAEPSESYVPLGLSADCFCHRVTASTLVRDFSHENEKADTHGLVR
jgi:hypothetical protein